MSGCPEKGWEEQLTVKGCEGIWGDGAVLYLDCGDGYMAMCIFQNS